MVVHVGDAVVVLNRGTVGALHQDVLGSQTVLDDEQGLAPAVPVVVEDGAQARRVDLPAPLGGLEGGIGNAAHEVAPAGLGRLGNGLAHGHVVGEGDEVDGVLPQQRAVLLGDLQLDALVSQGTQQVAGVLAAHVEVPEGVVGALGLLGRPDVTGIGGQRVGGHGQDHAADLDVGVDLVGDPRGGSGGDELVVDGLVEVLLSEPVLGGGDAAGQEGLVEDGVDLVEGEPVPNPLAVSLEQGAGVALEEADEAAVGPAVIGAGQVERGLVVADGDQRLDAVLLELVEDPVVEGQPLLVGLGLVTEREDTAPGDGEAEDLEAHLRQQGDVLGVTVVEVDGLKLEVVRSGGLGGRGQDAPGHDVLNGQALAVLVVGALDLVGSGGSAPQEAAGEAQVRVGRWCGHCSSSSVCSVRCRFQKVPGQ